MDSRTGVPPLEATKLDRIALHRAVETAHRVKSGWAEPLVVAFDATRLRDPDTYRVRRLGPFELVVEAEPAPRLITPELADELVAALQPALPLLVEGSQSPLALKAPCRESDIDLLVPVRRRAELEEAARIVKALRAVPFFSAPLSPAVVHRSWLRLPAFYSAVELDPRSPDRRWWSADEDERLAEIGRRIQEGLRLMSDAAAVAAIRNETLRVAGADRDAALITEWSVTPRWHSIDLWDEG